MRKMLSVFIAFTACLGSLVAETTQTEQMLDTIDAIKSTFHAKYAPIEWKGKHLDWDIDREAENAKTLIQKMQPNTKQFQRIVRAFLGTTKDYHVNSFFFSTEWSMLPFRVKGAEGRYFVTWVDENSLSFRVGDELILFDGKPVAEVLADLLQSQCSAPYTETDKALTEGKLTFRSGSAGEVVPSGKINISVMRKGASKATTYKLQWTHNPEKITRALSETRGPKGEHHPFLHKKMEVPFYGDFKEMQMEGEEELIGARNSPLPRLGEVIWEAPEDSFFDAYIYTLSEGKRVGFVRIPSYDAWSEEADEFGQIMAIMEDYSDVLVIDQLDNPGGYVLFMYGLLSRVTETPLAVPSEQMSLIQEDVYFAIDDLDYFETVIKNGWPSPFTEIGGYHFEKDAVNKVADFYKFLISQWNAGKNLSNGAFHLGISHIAPNPYVRYSKPILVLINELDFSCGDFFPAILQDNGRATLMGARTAGAGGSVEIASFPNRFGIEAYSMTTSIAERKNGQPIENLGVTPDITYTITADDLQNNYRGYIEAINDAVRAL